MPRYIVKFRNCYMEWSTIVDCPISFGMPLEDFEVWYLDAHGEPLMESRVERADAQGTSCLSYSLPAEDLVAGNRAGPNESELTEQELYQAYCMQEPIRDGWVVPVVEVGEGGP